jgi:hypothetical protein
LFKNSSSGSCGSCFSLSYIRNGVKDGSRTFRDKFFTKVNEISLQINFTKTFDKVCDSLLVETRKEIEVKFKKILFAIAKTRPRIKIYFFATLQKIRKQKRQKIKKLTIISGD